MLVFLLTHSPPPSIGTELRLPAVSWDADMCVLLCVFVGSYETNCLSILINTYQRQCSRELKWQLWLCWSISELPLSEPMWHSQSTPPPPPAPLPSTLVSDYWHLTDLPSVCLLFGFLILSFSYCRAWGFAWQTVLCAKTHAHIHTAL